MFPIYAKKEFQMKITNYDILYSLPADELDNLSDDDMKKFLFQGTTNWDIYFDIPVGDDDISEFKDVSLLEFDNKKEFEKYLDEHANVIDYSLEHAGGFGKFYILIEKAA